VGVDHRRFDVLVPQQFLDGADIVTVFQEVRGERVPQRMAGHAFADPCHIGRLFHLPRAVIDEPVATTYY
jgi:hypothetical protein